MIRSAIILAGAIALAACGNAAPGLDAQLRARAVASLEGSFPAPNRIEPLAVWAGEYGGVCGFIAAPEQLRETRSRLRFYYTDDIRHGQVEMHELVMSNTAGGSRLIMENRVAFDSTWNTTCAPAEPYGSWLRGMVG